MTTKPLEHASRLAAAELIRLFFVCGTQPLTATQLLAFWRVNLVISSHNFNTRIITLG